MGHPPGAFQQSPVDPWRPVQRSWVCEVLKSGAEFFPELFQACVPQLLSRRLGFRKGVDMRGLSCLPKVSSEVCLKAYRESERDGQNQSK